MSEMPESLERSYGCSMGCGNPYDTIVIDVMSGETLFLCIPCHVKLSAEMLQAMTDGSNPEVMAKLNAAQAGLTGAVPGPQGRKRGHNAPTETDDPDLIAAYDDRVTTDDLPDEFR